MRASRVAIDPEDHTQVFDCLLPDHRWNGWAIPYFDRPTALRVIAMVTRGGDRECWHVVHLH